MAEEEEDGTESEVGTDEGTEFNGGGIDEGTESGDETGDEEIVE